MLSFYTMWNTKRLSDVDINKAKTQSRRQTATFPLKSEHINGTQIDFSLGIDIYDASRPLFTITARFSTSNIDYIAGYFYVQEHHRNSKIRQIRWRRVFCTGQTDVSFGFHQAIMRWDPETVNPRSFDYYLDIHQIKYKMVSSKSHFNATPILERQFHHQWTISDPEVKRLSNMRPVEAKCIGGWTFLCRFQPDSSILQLSPHCYFLPLETSSFELSMTVRYEIRGKTCRKSKCLISKRGNFVNYIALSKDILNESDIRLDIDLRIIKVFDFQNNTLPEAYWAKCNIV